MKAMVENAVRKEHQNGSGIRQAVIGNPIQPSFRIKTHLKSAIGA